MPAVAGVVLGIASRLAIDALVLHPPQGQCFRYDAIVLYLLAAAVAFAPLIARYIPLAGPVKYLLYTVCTAALAVNFVSWSPANTTHCAPL